MPTYKVTGPDGGSYKVTTPTEVSTEEIMSRLPQGARQAAPQPVEPTISAAPGWAEQTRQNLQAETGLLHGPRPYGAPTLRDIFGLIKLPFATVGEAVTQGQEAITGQPRPRPAGAPFATPGGSPAANAGDFAEFAASWAPPSKIFGLLNRFKSAPPVASAGPRLPTLDPRRALPAGDNVTIGSPWTPAEGTIPGVSASRQIAEESAGIAKRIPAWQSKPPKGAGFMDPIQGDAVKRNELLDRIAEGMARIDKLQRREKAVAEAAPITVPPRTIEATGKLSQRGSNIQTHAANEALQTGGTYKPPITAVKPGDFTGSVMRTQKSYRPIGGGSDAIDPISSAVQSLQNTPPSPGKFTDGVGYLASTILSRMERLGPEGIEISRRVSKTLADASRWYATNIGPVTNALERLNPTQRRLFVQAVEQGTIAPDPSVAAAQQIYSRAFGQTGAIPSRAQQMGMLIRHGNRTEPFEGLSNYFPHEFAPDVADKMFRQGTKVYSDAIRRLVETGQAKSLAEAAAIIKRYRNMDRKVGGLEFGRDLNLPGYIEDPVAAVQIRGWKVAQRFAELENYGRNSDHIQRIIGGMEAAGNLDGARRLHGLYTLATQPEPATAGIAWLANKVTSAEAFMKLPLAALPNLSQPFWLALRTNGATTLKAIAQALAPGGGQAARELGVLNSMSMRQLYQDLAGSTGTMGAIRGTAMKMYEISEKWVRSVGANAGNLWANKIAGRVAGGENTPELTRELGRLLLSPAEVQQVLTSRQVTPEQLSRMAWAVADQVMFLPSQARRSEFMLTPVGRALMQFKGFSMNLGRLFHQQVIAEAKAGNYKPLATLLAMTPVGMLIGESVADLRSLVSGTQRPTTIGARLLQNLTFVGGAGLASDLLQAGMEQGQGAMGNLGRFILGPGLSDTAEMGAHVGGVAAGVATGDVARIEQNLAAALRQGIRSIPIVGARLNRLVAPTAKDQRRQNFGVADKLGLTEKAATLESAETAQANRSRGRSWERTKRGMGL